MSDTEAEFKRKDAEYFALVGRTVLHGQEVAQVIEYQVLRGPEYLFTLQYADGRHVGSQRSEFYVLPTREQIATALDPPAFDSGSSYYDTKGASDRRGWALQKADAVSALFINGSQP